MTQTVLPIEVTVDRLIEFLAGAGLGTIRTISQEELGRDVFAAPSPTSADAAGAIMLQMALEGQTGDQIRAWLHDQPEAIKYRLDQLRPEPPVPDGSESGPLTVARPAIRDDTGACWQWRGFTDFLLFYRWLCVIDIQPFLDERLALGANILRCFSMVGWDECDPPFSPASFPEYYSQVRSFADALAARGLRLEFTLFADAQIVMPDATERKEHLRDCLNALEGSWN